MISQLMSFNSAKSQLPTWIPLAKTNDDPSQIIQYDYLNSHLLGIGSVFQVVPPLISEVPSAKFHIKINLSTQPVFQVEALGEGGGSIKHLFQLNSNTYGIYQTGPPNGLNYFQNPIGIGCDPIADNILTVNGSTKIKNDLYLGEQTLDPLGTETNTYSTAILSFLLTPPSIHENPNPTYYKVLSLRSAGASNSATVFGKLTTETFMMTTTPGLNKVLTSDDQGNGKWTDPSSFLDNYWQINNKNELYAFKNVGVWTQFPNDLFQVNNATQKFVIGDASDSTFGWGTSYLGFNSFKRAGQWTMESNSVDNGGSVLYGDIFGNIHFINVPTNSGPNIQSFSNTQMMRMTSMTISKKGDVGIGTRTPGVALDVNRNGETKIRSFSSGPHTSSLWAMNSNGGYGLSIDENGIGHIDENFWADPAHHIFTFKHSGRVGIGEVVDLDSYSGNSLLFVTGGITTEEVTVKVKENWVDFVFNKDYKLRSLSDLEKYIETNKHLPDIPASSEVEKNGIELGKMNSLLLKKIEELTLYVIELKKEVNELKEKSVVK
jgi:hypothetical protein